jgi:hypothetical protein
MFPLGLAVVWAESGNRSYIHVLAFSERAIACALGAIGGKELLARRSRPYTVHKEYGALDGRRTPSPHFSKELGGSERFATPRGGGSVRRPFRVPNPEQHAQRLMAQVGEVLEGAKEQIAQRSSSSGTGLSRCHRASRADGQPIKGWGRFRSRLQRVALAGAFETSGLDCSSDDVDTRQIGVVHGECRPLACDGAAFALARRCRSRWPVASRRLSRGRRQHRQRRLRPEILRQRRSRQSWPSRGTLAARRRG